MRFSTVNLGCKVNQAELEKITSDLEALNFQYVAASYESDFAILNTCTVTSNADKKSLKEVKALCALENIQHVFITGCYSELEINLFSKIDKKCFVVPQNKKMQLATIADAYLRNSQGFASHKPNYENRWQAFKSSRAYAGALVNSQSVFYKHTRAFIKIQDGCNAFCSYCRIPFARGAPVSRAKADVIAQVKKIAAANIPEIVLTGINLSTYNDALSKANFSQLVEEILNVAGNSFVRISSLEPHFLDDQFLNLISHANLVPHFHLPLQGSSNQVLKLMGRQYTTQQYFELLIGIRKRNARFSISTDVITGHPEETKENFEEGLLFLKQCNFSSIHVFPFSLRPLTSDFDKYARALKSAAGSKKTSNKNISSISQNNKNENQKESNQHQNQKKDIKKLNVIPVFASTNGNTKNSAPKIAAFGFANNASFNNDASKSNENKNEFVSAFEKKWRATTLRKLSIKLSANYLKKLIGVKQRVVLEKKIEEEDFAILENLENQKNFKAKYCWFSSESLQNLSLSEVTEKAKSKEVNVFYGTSEYYCKGYVFSHAKNSFETGFNCMAILRASS